MNFSKFLTIIVPAHNEANFLEPSIRTIITQIGRLTPSFEIIIAEDGSTDGTDIIADRLAREYDFIRHIHSDRRLGKGLAIKKAMKQADGKIIFFMDADLATGLENIKEFIEAVDEGGFGMAIASRWIKGAITSRSLTRRVTSRMYNLLARILFGDGIQDHQCGFKAFNKALLQDVLDETRSTGFVWDTEIIIRSLRKGYRIKEIPVVWTEKRKGYGLFSTTLKIFFDLLKLWWMLNILERQIHASSKRSIISKIHNWHIALLFSS